MSFKEILPDLSFLENMATIDPCQILNSNTEAQSHNNEELQQNSEESTSGRSDEVGNFNEFYYSNFCESLDKNEFVSLVNTQKHTHGMINQNIKICSHTINLCEKLSKNHITKLYGWNKSKPNDLQPSHWELNYPDIKHLIKSLIVSLKESQSPMDLKCHQYDAFLFAFNKILSPYQDCIYDLIEYPNDLVNEIDANGNLTGNKICVAELINHFLLKLFHYLKSKAYKQRVNDRIKMARRREKELLLYIDGLRQQYSRLLGIRVDLYLSADKKHWNHRQIMEKYHILMQKLRRSTTLHLNGYVTKLEYGFENQGLHIHCFFFFSGEKHRQDISIGRMIGEMWDHLIDGKHSYFNCNTSKNRKNYKFDALGIINRNDQTKYNNISKVMHYFAKFEQYVLHSSLERVKTINTGILPHLRKQMGRPNLTKHY
jgi:hypothetical protein